MTPKKLPKFGKTSVGRIGPPQGQKSSTLRTSTNPLRKTPKQTISTALPKQNFSPTGTSSTQPASLRGKTVSIGGMKKLAKGSAGRVVKGSRIRKV